MNQDLDAFHSLSEDRNKIQGDRNNETEDGVSSEKLPELKLEMSNKDLIKLTNKWEALWDDSEVKQKWLVQCDDNEKYWLGHQYYNRTKLDKDRPDVDNAIFEALETYLPQVTRRNPEAMVSLVTGVEPTSKEEKDAWDKYITDLKNTLGDIADDLKFRLKLKKVARQWAIYVLGAAKLEWDMNKSIPSVKPTRAKKIILDPDSTIDEDGYTGNRIGLQRKQEANWIIKVLENVGGEKGAVDVIKKLVKDDLGTEIKFKEWWTDEYMCWTLNKNVLLKKRNPHWNYGREVENESTVDKFGNETPGEVEQLDGENHFPTPKMPFVFLSVFNLGKQPIDETSLIGQNLSNQDRLNKRNRQIDKNVDSMNGGMVVSLGRSGLTKPQAKAVTVALRKGGTVAIPDGIPKEAIDRMSPPGLPADVYNDRQDIRNRLADIFGVRGSTAAGIQQEKTVRGKFQNRALDTDRIGGGVSEYLEQFADDVYNWMVQLLYVYDEKYAGMQGKPKIRITIKEGSLLPKDSQTEANQAMELAAAGKMSLIDLYKALEKANPEELAANAWLEFNAPEALYQDERIAQVIQARQQAASAGEEKPPSISINYKDAPPAVRSQILDKVGIESHPEAIAAFDLKKEAQELQNKQATTKKS